MKLLILTLALAFSSAFAYNGNPYAVCAVFNYEERSFPNARAVYDENLSTGNQWKIIGNGPCRDYDNYHAPRYYPRANRQQRRYYQPPTETHQAVGAAYATPNGPPNVYVSYKSAQAPAARRPTYYKPLPRPAYNPVPYYPPPPAYHPTNTGNYHSFPAPHDYGQQYDTNATTTTTTTTTTMKPELAPARFQKVGEIVIAAPVPEPLPSPEPAPTPAPIPNPYVGGTYHRNYPAYNPYAAGPRYAHYPYHYPAHGLAPRIPVPQYYGNDYGHQYDMYTTTPTTTTAKPVNLPELVPIGAKKTTTTAAPTPAPMPTPYGAANIYGNYQHNDATSSTSSSTSSTSTTTTTTTTTTMSPRPSRGSFEVLDP